MPYEQDREDRQYRERHRGHNPYDAGEDFNRDQRRPRNQQDDDRRRDDDRPRRDTSHDGDTRGRDERGDNRRDLDFRDPNFRGTNQLPDEAQRPGAFPRGMGPNNNRYEGDYRGGRGYYREEHSDWRRGHEVDRPNNRDFYDPYDGDHRRPAERPSGYGAPGEQVRPLGRNERYGDDSSNPRRYYEDSRNRRNDDYPGRDRARDDRDGRYHYGEDDYDRRHGRSDDERRR